MKEQDFKGNNSFQLSIDSTTRLLNSFSHHGNISSSDFAELNNYMNKESKLKTECDLSKIKERTDGRFYIYLKRKQIIAATYPKLIDKLYQIHFGQDTLTLENLYPNWMIWRRDHSKASNKTIKENTYLWASFFEDTDIIKIPLVKLKTIDFIRFFRIITKDGTITRRRFNDAKSILNNMFYYAIEQEIVDRNPLRDIDYRQFSYRPENKPKDVYSINEREQILNYLAEMDDLVSLAIQLDFCLVSRIGEIKSLKWSDIDYDNCTIRLQRQLLSSQEVNDDLTFQETKHRCVEHVKGKTSEGFRDLPLIPQALDILDRIKSINPNSEYLFVNDNDKPLTTITFNRHLKSICKELSIPYRSSHNIRFCVASLLYQKGTPATVIQKLLGHTTLAMTLHYLRNATPKDEVFSQVTEILSNPHTTAYKN